MSQPVRTINLPADVTAPSVARDFVRSALAWATPDVLDTVELLVSEIVTNCVLHARSSSTLTLTRDPTRGLRVEVCDTNPAVPALRAHQTVDSSGRGLFLVDALATAWGHTALDGNGKCVWFEVRA